MFENTSMATIYGIMTEILEEKICISFIKRKLKIKNLGSHTNMQYYRVYCSFKSLKDQYNIMYLLKNQIIFLFNRVINSRI